MPPLRELVWEFLYGGVVPAAVAWAVVSAGVWMAGRVRQTWAANAIACAVGSLALAAAMCAANALLNLVPIEWSDWDGLASLLWGPVLLSFVGGAVVFSGKRFLAVSVVSLGVVGAIWLFTPKWIEPPLSYWLNIARGYCSVALTSWLLTRAAARRAWWCCLVAIATAMGLAAAMMATGNARLAQLAGVAVAVFAGMLVAVLVFRDERRVNACRLAVQCPVPAAALLFGLLSIHCSAGNFSDMPTPAIWSPLLIGLLALSPWPRRA